MNMSVEDSSEGLFNLPLLAYAHKKKMLGNCSHFFISKKRKTTLNLKQKKKKMSLCIRYQKIKANYTHSENNEEKICQNLVV